MADRFEKPIVVGKTDTYTCTIDLDWLGDETIVSHSVTVDGLVVKNLSTVSDNVIAVSVTGITAGRSIVVCEWVTSEGRSDCQSGILTVADSCL